MILAIHRARIHRHLPEAQTFWEGVLAGLCDAADVSRATAAVERLLVAEVQVGADDLAGWLDGVARTFEVDPAALQERADALGQALRRLERSTAGRRTRRVADALGSVHRTLGERHEA